MSWIAPVFDRVLTDIITRTAKGFFNVSDWGRVYGNAKNINGLVNALFGSRDSFTDVTPQTITSIPAVADFNTTLASIEAARVSAGLPVTTTTGLVELETDWQAGPNEIAPDYLDVNDWEKNALLIRDFSRISANHRAYCGVASVGQSRIYQHRFRRYTWEQPPESVIRYARCGLAVCGGAH